MKLLSIILSVVVSASIDSTTLWIGNQTDIHLEALVPQGEQIQFPVVDNTISNGIEVISRSAIDTSLQADGAHYRQNIVITSFQDSLYNIDPFVFTNGQDSFTTNSLALNVIQPFVIDTTDAAIFGIKDVMSAPFWWWGTIRWILLGLLIAALLVGIGYLVKRFSKRNIEEIDIPQVPLRPADEVALEELNRIKEEKIWQQGKTKDYYSEITDVLREYISRVFMIGSVEMTTEEILSELKRPLKGEEDIWKELKSSLTLADLVKFAKWFPLPEENENMIRSATNFVNSTKHRISQPAEAEEQTTNSKTEN